MTDGDIKRFVEKYRNLKKVSLPGTSLGNAALLHFTSHCQDLMHLEVSGSGITAEGYHQLAAHPQWAAELKKLRLPNCSHDKKKLQGMREFTRSRPDLPIELVTNTQFREDGWWQMEVYHTTYKNGRKAPYKIPGRGWKPYY
jgi:hypothetical protein